MILKIGYVRREQSIVIILLNGPPRSGKDTVAKMMINATASMREYKMSMPLKKTIAVLYGLSSEHHKLIEEHKDESTTLLFGETYRNIQIAISESLMKPIHGPDVLGHLAVKHMRQVMSKHIVISDTGFLEEVKPLIKEYGLDNICAVQLKRPDHSYDGDSRGDLAFDSLGITWTVLDNRHDLDMLEVQVQRLLSKWGLIIRDV